MFIHKIQYHKTLNPKIWLPDNTMDPVVRRVIIAVASDFIDFMHSVGFQITRKDILDIVIYGSNANYFYDKHSDIDVYILMNLDAVQEKFNEIDFLTLYKSLYHAWRRQFKLSIRGIKIDLSLENLNKPKHGPGWWRSGPAYSVIYNKWIHELVRLDDKTLHEYHQLAKQCVKKTQHQARELVASNGRLDEFISLQKSLRNDAMRDNCPQPLVPETMAYKMLRSSGFFWRLMLMSAQRRTVELFNSYQDPQ